MTAPGDDAEIERSPVTDKEIDTLHTLLRDTLEFLDEQDDTTAQRLYGRIDMALATIFDDADGDDTDDLDLDEED